MCVHFQKPLVHTNTHTCYQGISMKRATKASSMGVGMNQDAIYKFDSGYQSSK